MPVDNILPSLSLELSQNNGTSPDIIERLLNVCTLENEFLFNGHTYVQNIGVAMGSPIAPAIAEFFMNRLERTYIPSRPDIELYCRYVDDCFLLLRDTAPEDNLKGFNQIHPNIKFTYASERYGKVAFLYVLLDKRDHRITTTIFRKSCHPGRFQNCDFETI